jgi:hypothetical protein
MKILRRHAFLALPAKVAFRRGVPWVFGSLCIKGDTIVVDGKPIDFLYQELGDVAADDSGDYFEQLDEMLEAGASYEIGNAGERDGRFDDEDLFLVLEDEDVVEIHKLLGECLTTFALDATDRGQG